MYKKWSERHWYDFDSDEMKQRLEMLIDRMKKESLTTIANQIEASYKKHVRREEWEGKGKSKGCWL